MGLRLVKGGTGGQQKGWGQVLGLGQGKEEKMRDPDGLKLEPEMENFRIKNNMQCKSTYCLHNCHVVLAVLLDTLSSGVYIVYELLSHSAT